MIVEEISPNDKEIREVSMKAQQFSEITKILLKGNQDKGFDMLKFMC
ncbi:15289_t:CDS:2 [Funneliformis geosporum]|uniref:15289_t:CDS:1 n=1 Tax=Funneliformis geosporum TaxID=1117311 RepID=A0A9W4SEI3_9GLOM|nr:15289_t:CDS:2 [Funneliformis geosporum]